MARVNQGVFKTIKNSFKELESAYSEMLNRYFTNGYWNCKYDFFTDFCYSANSFYYEAETLQADISSLEKVLKFELEKTLADYKNIQCECKNMQSDIKQKFNEVLEQICSGGGISDAEQETLEQLRIYQI